MIDLARLPNCQKDERLVYFLRRHPITLLSLVLGYIAFLLFPFIGFGVLAAGYPNIVKDPALFPVIVIGVSLFLLFGWLVLFQIFLDYYLDVWVVTNHRIVNISQSGLFNRQTSELRLYRIQDATASITGPLHTVLDFGKVEIQTAGEQSRFVFEDVSHPQEITKTILQLAEHDRSKNIDAFVDEYDVGEGGQKKTHV